MRRARMVLEFDLCVERRYLHSLFVEWRARKLKLDEDNWLFCDVVSVSLEDGRVAA
jgi:hypothetical protein